MSKIIWRMPLSRKILLVTGALAAAVVVILIIAAPSIQRSIFYPKPHALPAVVSQTTEQLLARLQQVLETNAPPVAKSLLPGLSDAEIAQLEAHGGFRLSDDLRAFYRWHNGMPSNSIVGLLPGQRFVPLAEVIAERAMLRQQSGLAFSIFAGHRKGWLHVLDDDAGDGYFYDPERSDPEGAFFFHFAEAGYYVWFPSLRNFLSGVIECYQTQAIKAGADAKSLDENTTRTEEIWSRLGKTREG